jgi:hypothetical protein
MDNYQNDLFTPQAQAVMNMDSEGADAHGVKRAKREFVQSTPEQTSARVMQAIKEGRHSTHHESVCAGCGEWASEFYWVDPQATRRRFCKACAIKMGRLEERKALGEDAIVFDPSSAEAAITLPPGVTRAEDVGLPEF